MENLDNVQLTKILEDTNLMDNLLIDIKHLDEIATYNQRNKKVCNLLISRFHSNSIRSTIDPFL